MSSDSDRLKSTQRHVTVWHYIIYVNTAPIYNGKKTKNIAADSGKSLVANGTVGIQASRVAVLHSKTAPKQRGPA
jgi:hypothetical protein